MAKEDLDTLGFKQSASKTPQEKKPEPEDRRQGFVAGMRPARARRPAAAEEQR